MVQYTKSRVTSIETIKPSSETALLHTTPLPIYSSIILYYPPPPPGTSSKWSHHLKKSFAETLTYFHPLVRRAKNINGASYVSGGYDVNEGATYVEANVEGDISSFVKQPDLKMLRDLLPFSPNERFYRSPGVQEILGVQVNHFNCDGMAIAVCFNHAVGDACTLSTFVETWAAVARGDHGGLVKGIIFDRSSLFPTLDRISSDSSSHVDVETEDDRRQQSRELSRRHLNPTDDHLKNLLIGSVQNRFVFDGSKIAALKERISKGPYLDNPTRSEAVSALIWGAVIAAARERDAAITDNMALIGVDFRTRISPPIPQRCAGNLSGLVASNCPMENLQTTADYNYLAGKFRDTVRTINNEYVTDESAFQKAVEATAEAGRKTAWFRFTSWCKFQFFEADFGWGRPIWISSVPGPRNLARFHSTPDGRGVEAWVSLSKEEMGLLEQNPDILEFASFTPSAA